MAFSYYRPTRANGLWRYQPELADLGRGSWLGLGRALVHAADAVYSSSKRVPPMESGWRKVVAVPCIFFSTVRVLIRLVHVHNQAAIATNSQYRVSSVDSQTNNIQGHPPKPTYYSKQDQRPRTTSPLGRPQTYKKEPEKKLHAGPGRRSG